MVTFRKVINCDWVLVGSDSFSFFFFSLVFQLWHCWLETVSLSIFVFKVVFAEGVSHVSILRFTLLPTQLSGRLILRNFVSPDRITLVIVLLRHSPPDKGPTAPGSLASELSAAVHDTEVDRCVLFLKGIPTEAVV